MNWLKMKSLWADHKKAMIGGGIALLLALITITVSAYYVLNQETITQESTSFVVNVNDEVEQDATKYLKGIKDPTQAVFNLDDVDTKTIGIYDASIEYKGETYNIKIDVRDMEAPKVEVSQTEFEYPTNASIDDINKDINDCITITDNCDEEFDPIAVVTETPTEPSEQTYDVVAKDKSGNTSEKVQIKVTYTEPEEEPENEEPENNGSTSNGGSSSSGSTSGGSTSNGSSSSGNQGSGNSGTTGGSTPAPTPTPQPEPTPTPQPEPTPTPEPETPQVHYPDVPEGSLIGGEFPTKEASQAWADAIVNDPNSEWYYHNYNGIKLSNGNWYVWIDK